jgi:HEAT repeat protein
MSTKTLHCAPEHQARVNANTVHSRIRNDFNLPVNEGRDDWDVDAITSQMKNASPSVQAKLVEILSEMGGPSVVTALVEALGDEASQVRREAADAIGDIGGPAGGLGEFESTEAVYARLDR